MRKIDYTQEQFMFNGRSSKDFSICIEKVPDLNKPEREANVYHIPGKNGDVIEQLDSFKNIERTYNVWAANDDYLNVAQDFDAIADWLYNSNGYCRLEDDFEPTIFRLAYFVGPMNIENLLNLYGKTKIEFSCRPEKYLKSGENVATFSTSSLTIYNPTKYIAKPLIKILPNYTSTSQELQHVEVSCSGRTIHIPRLRRGVVAGSYALIDSDNMEVTGSASSYDSYGEFPVIEPGEQTISITYTMGNAPTIEVVPRWYTI